MRLGNGVAVAAEDAGLAGVVSAVAILIVCLFDVSGGLTPDLTD